MYIISIAFQGSKKSYDYLYVNPKGVKVDVKTPLRSLVGCDGRGALYNDVKIVKIAKAECLPSYVTSQIEVDEGNICVMRKITASRQEKLKKLKPKSEGASSKSPKPMTAKTEARPKENELDKIKRRAVAETHKLFEFIQNGLYATKFK